MPFLFVSEAIGEDDTIMAMLNGAADFVIKSKIGRLVPAIKRALHEHDIEKKQRIAEEALIASEISYRRLFESAKDGILILNAVTGRILDVNPFLIQLLGYTREQFIEKRIWEIGFFTDIVDNHEKFVELQQKKYVRYDNLPLKTTDGHQINVEFVSNVYTVDHHKVIQCNIRDITQRKQAEDELVRQKEKAEASDRLKTAFLNNISHELRTPLNGILGFGEMIIDPDLSMEDKVKYLKILNTSSDRLLNTVNNFMDSSLIVTGNIEVRSSLFSPIALLETIRASFQESASSKNLTIKLTNSIKPQSYLMSSDQELMKKILSHLIDNAIKFSDKGGIEVGCRNRNGVVEFFVKDKGIGIAADKLPHIFDNFIQGDIKLHPKYGGSGLGLSIVKGFVEILGGTIYVESVPGSGSRFSFSIPA
jgi:PAS domain S-box-containing protein